MSLGKFKSLLFEMDGINNNNPIFNCIVTFMTKHGIESENTSARLDVGTGDISLLALKLPNDKYHLGFQEKFQTYSSTVDGIKISGKSDKMGDYSVIIVPTSAKK
jgi:hypothetical protein